MELFLVYVVFIIGIILIGVSGVFFSKALIKHLNVRTYYEKSTAKKDLFKWSALVYLGFFVLIKSLSIANNVYQVLIS